MDYNLITNNATCHQQIIDTVPLSLVYYSHIPTAIIALMVGFFVFFKNPKELLNRILLGLSVTFSLWLALDLIVWIMNYNTILTMFAWTQLEMLNAIFFFFALYFVYVYIDKKDISFTKKMIMGMLILPIIILSPFKYLEKFTMISCTAIENNTFIDYVFYLEVFISAWIILLSVQRYIRANKEVRKQIVILSVGITLFLLMFFVSSYISAHYDNYNYELYGHFGMTIFMGFIAYLIVKFKAFNIKLIATQALMVTLIILIGSQFAFIKTFTNQILTGITLALAVGFGWILIRSVKKEVQQREELEVANKKIDRKNEQLAVANAKLKELDLAKTSFIGLVNHQLKHAPTPIKGYVSMFLEGSYGEISAEQRSVLEKINAANERQIKLADTLLDITRLESGKIQMEFQKQPIEDICQSVYASMEVTAKEKNLSFEYVKPKKVLPELVMDKSKIFESIFNFVDNAVKYTPAGKISLKVELDSSSHYKPQGLDEQEKKALAGPVVRVTVSDTGSGISKENIPQLFAKFSRKDSAKLNADGTGLGLYLVKLTIEAHGGRTWAQSKGEGKGSQFIIELPVETLKEILEQVAIKK